MGYEAENAARMKAFADWCVDAEMMAAAQPDALFMHCLPAHRGEEVDAEVIDGPQSVVWDEAENRMHVQKALMEYLAARPDRLRRGAVYDGSSTIGVFDCAAAGRAPSPRRCRRRPCRATSSASAARRRPPTRTSAATGGVR